MKLSMKLRDEIHQNPLIRAKIPVTILGFPFLTGVVSGDPSDLSFSLRTNFSAGPSLSVSYHPALSSAPVAATSTANYAAHPFSLSLKSGIGVFGSSQDSPLVFTVRFNLLSTSNSISIPTLTPTFSLHIKPQYGSFSLRKSTSSSVLDGCRSKGDSSNGSAPIPNSENGFGLDGPLKWKDLNAGAKYQQEINGLLSGIFVTAKTMMPLTKRSVVNCRWGVNFASESNGQGSRISRPMLALNKIGIERVEVVKRVEVEKKSNGDSADLELLKGMCGWMGREMEELLRQNSEIMQAFEAMRSQGSSLRKRGEEREIMGRRVISMPERSSDFEKWRSRKSSVEENGQRDSKKSVGMMSEMESELQKAIKASNAS